MQPLEGPRGPDLDLAESHQAMPCLESLGGEPLLQLRAAFAGYLREGTLEPVAQCLATLRAQLESFQAHATGALLGREALTARVLQALERWREGLEMLEAFLGHQDTRVMGPGLDRLQQGHDLLASAGEAEGVG